MGDINSQIREMATLLDLPVPNEISPEYTLMIMRALKDVTDRVTALEVRNIYN